MDLVCSEDPTLYALVRAERPLIVKYAHKVP